MTCKQLAAIVLLEFNPLQALQSIPGGPLINSRYSQASQTPRITKSRTRFALSSSKSILIIHAYLTYFNGLCMYEVYHKEKLTDLEVIYMEIIEYYSSNNKEYWLSKINECDWVAGKFLYELIKQDKLKELVGDDVKVLLLTNEFDLISFCTLSKVDDIPTTELTPWIGFVYTFPEYRGHRHMGKLISYAEEIVKSNGFSNIYISTNQEGIYEKYGFNFMGIMKDMNNEDSRVYIKTL